MSPSSNHAVKDRVDVIADEPQLSLGETAFLCGTSPEIILTLVELGLIDTAGDGPEPVFSLRVIPLVQRMMRLHRQMDITWDSMDLILSLLNRINELESILERLTLTRRPGTPE